MYSKSLILLFVERKGNSDQSGVPRHSNSGVCSWYVWLCSFVTWLDMATIFNVSVLFTTYFHEKRILTNCSTNQNECFFHYLLLLFFVIPKQGRGKVWKSWGACNNVPPLVETGFINLMKHWNLRIRFSWKYVVRN